MSFEDTFWDAKVTAEISATDVMQLASEVGMPITPEEAAELLRHEVRARGMWNHMIQAGRDYIAASLESRRHRAWWELSCHQDNAEERYDA
jgi:6-phosphogluconate dehydrogenase